MFYLETSAIMKLSSVLSRITGSITSCFTSGLSIFEIISGMSVNDFQRRKAILRNLMASNLSIDWKLPGEKVTDAFGFRAYTGAQITKLQNTVRLLLESEDWSEGVSKTRSNEAAWKLDEISEIDKEIALPPQVKLSALQQEFRRRFGQEGVASIRELWAKVPDQRTVEENAEVDRLVTENTRSYFETMVRDLVANVWEGDPYLGLQELYRAYDHSLDRHIALDVWYQMNGQILGNQPAVNDFYDAGHTMYLGDNISIKLVTNDHKFYQLIKSVFPRQAMLVADFEGKVGLS